MDLKELVNYLVCPKCSSSDLVGKKNTLYCCSCKSSYDVSEGVPVLLVKDNFNRQEVTQKIWFEKHYSQFSKHIYFLENWRKSMLERIFDSIAEKKIKFYLDIGCGATGYTVIEAARKNKWISFGVDISIEAMVRAKNLAEKEGVADKTGFVVCSAENLPFKKESLDFVSAISLLEHLENDIKVISAMYKILKQKGMAYICVPNTYKRMWLFLWPIYYYFDKQIGHKRHYSIEGLNKKMETSGFKPIKHFYNAHLKKLSLLALEKIGLKNDERWWKIERKDFNSKNNGIQLNAVYQKVKQTGI